MVIILSDTTKPSMHALYKWVKDHGKTRPKGYHKLDWDVLMADDECAIGIDQLRAMIAAWGTEFTDWLRITPKQ